MKIKNIFNKIGLITLPVLCGWLGAFGGADNTSKAWRRILIPGLINSYAFSNTQSLLTISIMSMSLPISMGYGIPDESDDGSKLGKFYYNLFNKNTTLANVFTRGTIGILIALSLISIPIIKHNWILYGVCSLGITLINALISWRGFGNYILFKKTLSWVETIVWGFIALFSIIITYIK